jgi:methylated-DNA-[protein]-cysteine S-methyltransferase
MLLSTNSVRLRRIEYETPFGPGTLIWRGGVLATLELPDAPRSRRAARDTGVTTIDAGPSTSAEKKLAQLLKTYFSGLRVSFPLEEIPLDRDCWTSFQNQVALALAVVPYGETITYAELAAAAGHPRACRAVGNFMAANPYPVIIPCHRVIRSDGSLGNFSAGEGWKARLLELEGSPSPSRENPIDSVIRRESDAGPQAPVSTRPGR